jgi:uncharacterized repeat protein (TIGR01451 family)
MVRRAALVAALLACVLALVLRTAPVGAHRSPLDCTANGLSLTIDRDTASPRNGETINYTVAVSNTVDGACDITDTTVTLTLPDADGTPNGKVVTLATSASYPAGDPAGAPPTVLGPVSYQVAVNPGVDEIVVEATASGMLHDAPTDHAARISRPLSTPVTQPPLAGHSSPSAVLRLPLPSTASRSARRDAACVSMPNGVATRAGDLSAIRVRVRRAGRKIVGALVRMSGPGFVRRRLTTVDGVAVFRVRPRRSGRLVIQSDRCPGADRIRVRPAVR